MSIGFWETLLATVTGAVFAGGVTWLIFWQEGRRTYRQRFEDALVGLLLAIPSRVAELDRHENVLDAWEANGSHGDAPLTPGPYDLGVRLEAARLIARGNDAKTLASVADAFYSLTQLQPLPQRARLSHLAELVRKWQHGELGEHPWSTFTKFAFEVDAKTGMTPPPPWDAMRRIITNPSQPPSN